MDHCLVGEPTSAAVLGDMIKTGRRGSLNAWITVEGVEGHVAYPDRAANPVPVLVALCDRLARETLDEGHPGFQRSNLELTELEVGNPAHNVIPPRARARLNIRFNPAHTGAGLTDWLQHECEAAQVGFRWPREPRRPRVGRGLPHCARRFHAHGRAGGGGRHGARAGPFDLRRNLGRALHPRAVPGGGVRAGGRHHAQADERTPVADLEALTRIYGELVARYFSP